MISHAKHEALVVQAAQAQKKELLPFSGLIK